MEDSLLNSYTFRTREVIQKHIHISSGLLKLEVLFIESVTSADEIIKLSAAINAIKNQLARNQVYNYHIPIVIRHLKLTSFDLANLDAFNKCCTISVLEKSEISPAAFEKLKENTVELNIPSLKNTSSKKDGFFTKQGYQQDDNDRKASSNTLPAAGG